MDHDILVVGGGPAGLSFVASLAGAPLRLGLIERQAEDILSAPPYDGREIALTHRSCQTLERLGAWNRLSEHGISPLNSARVLNGSSSLPLTFEASGKRESLGFLVSNNDIRRTLFDCIRHQENVALLAETEVIGVKAANGRVEVRLASRKSLSAKLLVVADSRISAARDQLGIGAEMNRLGQAMLVCRVKHTLDHGHVATEWFGEPHTIAMLPLNGRVSSAILTLPQPEADKLAAFDGETLGAEIASRYHYRLGTMKVVSSVHVYPLVTTFANKFAVPGAALIGDAAVGMHPVTAHGFNLGLASADTLASLIRSALSARQDWAGWPVLQNYDRRHRRAARLLYDATKLIYRLYGNDRLAARITRHASIRLARVTPLFRHFVTRRLLEA